MDAKSVLASGSTWVGEFRFHESETLPVEIVISSEVGGNVEAIYRTENKFEWEISGTLNGNYIDWRFVSSKHPDGEPLIQSGKLTSTLIDASTMEVQFYDASDMSSTRFTLTKVTTASSVKR